MHRKFIATVTAAAIAITAFTTGNAAAGEREDRFARIAAGVLGIAIIGKIIHDKNKRDDAREQAVARQRHEHAPVVRPHRPHRAERPQRAERVPAYRAPRAERRVEPRPLPPRYQRKNKHQHANKKLLPQKCFKSYDTRRGQVLMFGRRCLEKNYRHAASLPQQCAQKIRTFDGRRYGYDARCLRGAGYSLARG